jgi:hypothetical protein
MADNTIKEFLVGLGWQSNDAQYAKFASMLEGATLKANLLATALEEGARKVYDSVKGIAESFEGLYYAAARAGTSAAGMKAFEYAASQLGSTVEEARASLVAMGKAVQYDNPGNIAALNALGFGYDKVTKKIEYQKDLAEKAARLPDYIRSKYAAMVGLDLHTLQAMKDVGTFQARIDESRKSMAAAGLDPAKAAADAVEFGNAQRKLFNDIGNDYDKLVTTMMKDLTPGLKDLDKWLGEHQPEILKDIDDVAKAVTSLVEGFKYLLKLNEDSANWDVTKSLGAFMGIGPPGKTGLGAAIFQPQPNSPDPNKREGGWGGAWGWVKGMFGGGGGDAAAPSSDDLDKLRKAMGGGATRGIDFGGGKDISLLRATDGGANGTGFGPNSGAPRDIGTIKVNGVSVDSGNPLPVTFDTSGFGSSAGGAGGGLFGSIGAGIKSLFGGSGGNGGPMAEKPVGHWWTPERMAYAADYLMKNANLTKEGAAGLVARMAGVESPQGPGSLNPISGAAGIAQGLGDRRAGYTGTFEQQLANEARELNTTEKRAGNILRAAHTAAEAKRGASAFERAEGYNGQTGLDNFTNATPYNDVMSKIDAFHNSQLGGDTHHHDNSVTGSHNVIHNNITVDGSQDPGATANMIAAHVKRASQDLTRDMVGATQ